MTKIKALAAFAAGAPLQPFEYEAGELGAEHVEIAVEYCGICHSDLSMWHNDWGRTSYPFVPGHEVVGTVVAAGAGVKNLKIGDRVGVGWIAGSCLACAQCLSGHQNLCPNMEETIVGRHGGFAERVRAHWAWAIPLPAALDAAKFGPMFCGGITVFQPIVMGDVKPTDRVGVIGIGGLGHMALQFLKGWGCEVTAFTSSDSKREEAKSLGAHRVVNSRDEAQIKAIEGQLDFILTTVNVSLDWDAILAALAPRGRLHFVGATLEPVPVPAFALIGSEKSLAGSPTGPPQTSAKMLDFCARHAIAPITEEFPMSQANEAFQHLEDGKARYRIVLKQDLGSN
jgi:uncharacterized zinc-type alcohol dehydrogenase-like protein